MDSVGLLLRGESLGKLPSVCDRFDDCYILNNWKEEIKIFSGYLYGKNIIHFANSMSTSMLSAKNYRRFNINKVVFSFTRGALEKKGDCSIVRMYNEIGVKTIDFMPEKYADITKRIKNTGVSCVFYVSEIVKPKIIWVLGLDFYCEDYLVKRNKSHQLAKAKRIGLADSFIDVVKRHPHIEYNMVTCYKKLPKISNLNILGI